mmetsp:Transcript_24403/g.39176  ORF Transcript_24403/g.39176 Transcript_24403/m.39176 type:complete len:508 (+) Transcript_24403:209-1732(+)
MRRRRLSKRPRSGANRNAFDTKTGHSHEKRQRRGRRSVSSIIATHCDCKDDDRDGVVGRAATSEDEKEERNIDDAKENAAEGESRSETEESEPELGSGEQTDPVFSSTFECPVCKQLLYNPVTLNCGHSLCEHCMIQYIMGLRSGTDPCKCPAGCRTTIAFDLPEINITMRRALVEKYPSFTRERGEEINQDHPTLWYARQFIKILRIRRHRHARELLRMRIENERKVMERIDDQPPNDRGDFVVSTWSWLYVCFAFTPIFMDVELLKLDWQKVGEGQVWRLVTGFLFPYSLTHMPLFSVHFHINFIFSFHRLDYLGNYEKMIGSKRFCITLFSCVLLILMWSYMEQEHQFCDGFPSCLLIWYMFVQYCREMPLLFLALLFYDCAAYSLNWGGVPFNGNIPLPNTLALHLLTLFSAFLFDSATRWIIVAHFEHVPEHSQHPFLGTRENGVSISLTQNLIHLLILWYSVECALYLSSAFGGFYAFVVYISAYCLMHIFWKVFVHAMAS